eukprot:CAMPEP_0201713500 /NCGR_PEP_ID=MMETSP0593-20130828/316_1 /ASSEMBLY_ACC=CAM_ASM_000672 /TAXON_ID=267983 /ORGANISM="Skeletonema japonicum, Strain CCMP2506" /LENGTH=310 /DNA_ID=CAMNT_0048202657 /DNA_START=265 /DNA_END=1197 /DNA_ORIENTATION=-
MPFEFADTTPSKSFGRKHRRGRGAGSQQKPSASFVSSTKGGQYSSAASTSLNVAPAPGSKGIEPDQNSCTGSLTYSASSSVFSAEDSADSSFAEIIKILDTEGGEGDSKFKAFMSERPDRLQNACGMDAPAVAGWMQRVEERSKEQQKLRQMEQKKATSKAFTEMRYSNEDDESSDDEMKMLGTIGGSADDDFVNGDVKKQPQESFVNQAFRTTTPPPNSRMRRTSTPPGAMPLVRTSSRHSKSSSDGSFGTPAPASPPPYSKSHSKPPARGRGSQSSKARGSSDISEPVYKNFWMCGFTDAFKFDGFKE